MKDAVSVIAKELDVHEAQVYLALERLKLIKKVSMPKLHWEENALGKLLLHHESLSIITSIVQNEIVDMLQPPRLGAQLFPPRKQCPKCGNARTNAFFGRSEKNEDGLTKWCLICLEQYNAGQHYG